MNAPLTCDAARELIVASADEPLADADELELRQHLGDCPDCAAYRETIARTVSVVLSDALSSVDPNPAIHPKLRRRLERKHSLLNRLWVVRLPVYQVAAAVVVAFGIGVYSGEVVERAAEPRREGVSGQMLDPALRTMLEIGKNGMGLPVAEDTTLIRGLQAGPSESLDDRI